MNVQSKMDECLFQYFKWYAIEIGIKFNTEKADSLMIRWIADWSKIMVWWMVL